MFRLNNKTTQVFFEDKSEMLLCGDTKYIIFINKAGETIGSSLSDALENGNQEMNKRLRYTKDIIMTMLSTSGKLAMK